MKIRFVNPHTCYDCIWLLNTGKSSLISWYCGKYKKSLYSIAPLKQCSKHRDFKLFDKLEKL